MSSRPVTLPTPVPLLRRCRPDRRAVSATLFRSDNCQDETARHFRSERRRREREMAAYRDKPNYHDGDPSSRLPPRQTSLEHLPPHPSGFCGDYLLSAPAASGASPRPKHSSANIWQLSRRIQKRLLIFLDGGE